MLSYTGNIAVETLSARSSSDRFWHEFEANREFVNHLAVFCLKTVATRYVPPSNEISTEQFHFYEDKKEAIYYRLRASNRYNNYILLELFQVKVNTQVKKLSNVALTGASSDKRI